MTRRVLLRPPIESDRAELIERLVASAGLHDPWLEPAEPDPWFERLLARSRAGADRSFLVCDADDGSVAGVMNLSQIVMGPFRSAFLGYYAFEPFAGCGYMRAAMPRLLRCAFDDLGLHRVQANVQPANEASIALVRGAGFRREGFSPRYLFIRGAWRDHEQWVRLSDDPPAVRDPA
ncbi:MAG: GNAT family N-acetyltransferase [Actinobacteria bacterium]|nr:GNAT family N-acetyltransferase [Actinomycetota bacterium]